MILQTQEVLGHKVITVVMDDEIVYFFEDNDWWMTGSLEELYSCLKGKFTFPLFVGQYEDVCKWINRRSVFGETKTL